jgi:hypothetical protein
VDIKNDKQAFALHLQLLLIHSLHRVANIVQRVDIKNNKQAFALHSQTLNP